MAEDLQSPEDKQLFNIMSYGSSLGLAGLVAFLASFRDIREDPTLYFSYRTIVGFVIGFAIGKIFWTWIGRKAAQQIGSSPDQ